MKELFGVLQTVAGDAQGRFNSSLTNLEYPDRSEFLVELGSKMANANSLAQIEDIERLWFELQREINESGKVARFLQRGERAPLGLEPLDDLRAASWEPSGDGPPPSDVETFLAQRAAPPMTE